MVLSFSPVRRAGPGENRTYKEELGNSFELGFEEVGRGEGNGQHRKQQNCIIGLPSTELVPMNKIKK
jgi:hypothetical protein